jgi:hypothetical protein
MKVYRKSGGIDPLILIFGIRWRGVFKFMLPTVLREQGFYTLAQNMEHKGPVITA